ncbi:hypothetical protein EHO57_13960 [Leptospira langatensis]|uniref:PNPLA domain-containing protein n=1 Tax=Leptospira langatensis TaxID=2484983 RepID=A0A5R2AT87_9LEPT|nr:patatin-like phospholipase family protein [Leptospira langatensis]TGJ99861.1 hypothetical protein EHO57_13960 [Leptospira langatensis]
MRKVGLIFAGGGAKGSFSVGVAKAFKEAGVNVTVVSGTSVGAIVGGCFVTNKLSELEAAFGFSKGKESFFKNWKFPRLFRAYKKRALFDNSPIVKLARTILSEDDFRGLTIKFGCAATNIETGDLATFSTETLPGQMIDAILASAALPPAFVPVRIQNSTFVDGGLREAIPAKLAIDLDPACDEYVIILPTKGMLGIPDKKFGDLSMGEYALRLFDIMFSQIYEGNLNTGLSKYWAEAKFRIIEPEFQIVHDTLDFDPGRALASIEEGYRQGRKFILNPR